MPAADTLYDEHLETLKKEGLWSVRVRDQQAAYARPVAPAPVAAR